MSLLILESKDKESGGSDTDYTIKFNRPIKNVKTMDLVDYMIPNVVYPINEDYNDNLDYTYSGAKTATINSWNYTGQQLATELQTELIATGATTMLVTYNEQRNKLTFEETGGVAFTIATQTTTPKILQAIGVTEGQTCTTSVFTATNQVDMSFPQYFNITLEFNGRQTDSVFTVSESFTFLVMRKNSGFLDFVDNSNVLSQRVRNPSIDFDEVRVRWFCPDKDANDSGLWNFSGVSNRLVLRLNRGADP